MLGGVGKYYGAFVNYVDILRRMDSVLAQCRAGDATKGTVQSSPVQPSPGQYITALLSWVILRDAVNLIVLWLGSLKVSHG